MSRRELAEERLSRWTGPWCDESSDVGDEMIRDAAVWRARTIWNPDRYPGAPDGSGLRVRSTEQGGEVRRGTLNLVEVVPHQDVW